MNYANYEKGDYLLTTNPDKTDLEAVCSMLSKSYWAANRRKDVIENSLKNSLCFNMYYGSKQIGIARMITDHATFAYLCDVYIEEDHRGHGLGKWLMECILSYPSFVNIRRIDLATQDAHELYRKYGFTEVTRPQNMMWRIKEEVPVKI